MLSRARSSKVKLRVGASRIDRKGLFAGQDIKHGRRIIQYMGEKITKEEGERRLARDNVYIFALNDRYDIDGKALKNTARYINHSCDPNCATTTTTRTIWIVALRDIQEGEELSYDYGYPAEHYERYPCTCGAENCCGYMLAPHYWGVIKRQG